jgi:hypothetical protein
MLMLFFNVACYIAERQGLFGCLVVPAPFWLTSALRAAAFLHCGGDLEVTARALPILLNDLSMDEARETVS